MGQGISRFHPAQGALGNYLGDCARWPREMQVWGVSVLHRKGQIRHDGGVIDGAGGDARELSDHLASYLRQNSA
jgi:hypothetical protein